MRIIADRMWDHADKEWLVRQLDEKLGTTFSTSFGTLFEAYNETVPPFVTFMRQVCRLAVCAWPVRALARNAEGMEVFRLLRCAVCLATTPVARPLACCSDPTTPRTRPAPNPTRLPPNPSTHTRTTQNVDVPVYEAVRDMVALKDLLTERLEDYALEPGHSAMDLVLFRDALSHVCRIHRILGQPRGNALLVGVGGSGRKSLARLAAFVAELKCFTIEITKNYRQTEFREDLKGLYRQAGVANKPTVFLFDETQVRLFVACMGGGWGGRRRVGMRASPVARAPYGTATA